MFRRYILPYLAFGFYRALASTWRFRFHEPEALKLAIANNHRRVLAHWHGDELVLLSLIRRYRVAAMTSTSRDGQLIDRIVHLMGGRTSRGSSTRGGVTALKGLLNLAKQGYNPSVAVDGPKGPLHKVKPGIFELSRVLQAPIFPIGIAADRAFVFRKSWNQTFLPKPFARIEVYWGEPMGALESHDDPRSPAHAKQLELALNNAKQQARQLLVAT